MNLKKKFGKVFMSKFVGTGPLSYKKKNLLGRGLSQRLRNIDLELPPSNESILSFP